MSLFDRSPQDICLLCRTNQANQTNSHWIPAAMLKSMIGKRDQEESYEFSTLIQARLSDYYGRANLRNTDPDLKPHHYAFDYIFCTECEVKLGRLESHVIPLIQDQIRLSQYHSNYLEHISFLKIPYKSCIRLNNSVFRLFIYSLVWRMCLIYRVNNSSSPLDFEMEERLREILNMYLNLKLSDEELNNVPSIDFQVITADYFANAGANVTYTESIHKNPTLFFINEFIIILHENGYSIDPDNNYKLTVKSIIEFPEILNDSLDHPKIGFISHDHWSNLTKEVIISSTEEIINQLCRDISTCSGRPYVESRELLHRIGFDINRRTGELLMQCFSYAAHIICEELGQA